MTTQITITWNSIRSNAGSTSATFTPDKFWDSVSNNLLMESIYKATNLQSELADFGAYEVEIELWNSIKEILPANRSHTSLSVGDEIQINRSYTSIANQDGPTYRVADIGFSLVEKVGA